MDVKLFEKNRMIADGYQIVCLNASNCCSFRVGPLVHMRCIFFPDTEEWSCCILQQNSARHLQNTLQPVSCLLLNGYTAKMRFQPKHNEVQIVVLGGGSPQRRHIYLKPLHPSTYHHLPSSSVVKPSLKCLPYPTAPA